MLLDFKLDCNFTIHAYLYRLNIWKINACYERVKFKNKLIEFEWNLPNAKFNFT